MDIAVSHIPVLQCGPSFSSPANSSHLISAAGAVLEGGGRGATPPTQMPAHLPTTRGKARDFIVEGLWGEIWDGALNLLPNMGPGAEVPRKVLKYGVQVDST